MSRRTRFEQDYFDLHGVEFVEGGASAAAWGPRTMVRARPNRPTSNPSARVERCSKVPWQARLIALFAGFFMFAFFGGMLAIGLVVLWAIFTG